MIVKTALSRNFISYLVIFIIISCDNVDHPIPKQNADTSISVETVNAKKGKPTSYSTYLIRKGQHSTTSPYKSIKTNLLRFEAVFDKSAIYTTVLVTNQADINKLYGMSDCGSLHQNNSARYGWRWYNNRLEILGYVYNSGKWSYKYITSVDLDKPYTYEISLLSQSYLFSVNGVKVSLPRNCSGYGSGYMLYPYFGGDETAPHDITIRIRDL
ncbi:hypothetical protein [Pontibacter amylolyticus]|uniref:Uncharacterized protein n=1 Tax=Pontibacter amylolyticus TaxID=1424080 RepID=A0ABQ1WHX9_9BACT|nr:hypothetical protein [Pontibacter amylolyticus]GGG30051.1 hypothetical protein GCM10011323_36890 [Pontibacter amylolyticus]